MFSKLFNVESFIHGFKTVIAVIIGLIITQYVEYPANQWILVSIVLIMCSQVYVGSMVQKAYLRILGTFIGCLIASLILLTLGHNTFDTLIALCLSTFFFGYITSTQENLSAASALGAVTTVIIMINPEPSVHLAVLRCSEISAGVFIAAAVSQFILPIHARKHLRKAQANTLEALKAYYNFAFEKPDELLTHSELEESIAQSLLKQRQLAKEATREFLGKKFDNKLFMQSLHCERSILRCITFMQAALHNLKKNDPPFAQLQSLQQLNESIMHAFDIIINLLRNENPQKQLFYVPSLAKLKEELETKSSTHSQEAWIDINGFLFMAEILIRNLTNLKLLYSEQKTLQEENAA